MMALCMSGNAAQTSPVARDLNARYRARKSTVNPVVEFDGSLSKRRTSAPITIAGAFLCLHVSFMAVVCGRHSCLPGSFCPGPSTRTRLPPLFV